MRKKDYKNNYKNLESSSEIVIDDETMHMLQAALGYKFAVTSFGEQIATAVLNEFYAKNMINGHTLSRSDYQQVCMRISNWGGGKSNMAKYVKTSVENHILSQNKAKIASSRNCRGWSNQFEQNEYDMDELERLLVEN